MDAQANRYLLTGGGTGGHVYPAIAMADELRRREPDSSFLYVGVRGKAEESIVPRRGYDIAYVTSRGWPGARLRPALLLFLFSLGWGVLKAIRLLLTFRPTVILATGGYVSAPVMLAWILLKRLKLTDARAFVHEQNTAPGRLNRLVGALADRVGVSFSETLHYFPNSEWLGYPVRREVGSLPRSEARQNLEIPEEARLVLVFGGSQGARTINRAVVEALPHLLQDEKLWVVHGVGRYQGADYDAEGDTSARLGELSLGEPQRRRYRLEVYLHQIEQWYAAADLVVCRAGAGTLTEIAACGLPAVVIPKANLPGDHQVKNAHALAEQGGAQVLYERIALGDGEVREYVPGDELARVIKDLLARDDLRQTMSQQVRSFADADALDRIAERIQQLANQSLPPLPDRPPAPPAGPDFTEMTGAQLVSYLLRHDPSYLSEKERSYLSYRCDGYLAHPAWQVRNHGIKLVGLLQRSERLEMLLHFLHDRRRAPIWHRLLGGDFLQVGFLRRNIMLVLRQLDHWDDSLREALLWGLRDPYFEVRSWAAQTIVHFAEHIGPDPEFFEALDHLLTDRSFEVICAGMEALAEIDRRPEIYDALRPFFIYPNWRVRASLAQTLCRLLQRKVLSAQTVKGDLDLFLLTSTGFSPRFALRERMVELSQTLAEASREEEAPLDADTTTESETSTETSAPAETTIGG